MPAVAEANLNALASRTLDAIGAQRDMPGLTVDHGWSLFGWLFGARPLATNLLLLAILLACAAVIVLAGYSAGRGRTPAWQKPGIAAAAGANPAAPHLDLADAYAREGRFAEAIHELLLQALADIRAQAGTPLAPSLTSREILREANLADIARDALRVLIGRVEWTYFGLRPAANADYQACRQDLETLRQVLRPA